MTRNAQSDSPLEAAIAAVAMATMRSSSASAEGAVGAAGAAGAAAPAEATEDKTDFNVELTDAGANKIGVIKAVRAVKSGLGLADAKKLVESAPALILEGASKEEADKAKAELEAAGAKVTIK